MHISDRVLWNQFSDDLVNVSMHDEINSDTVELARYNESLYNEILGIRMILFTPVIVKYMKNNVHITEPRYHEQILPLPLALRYIEVPLYLKSMLKKLKQQQRFRLLHSL